MATYNQRPNILWISLEDTSPRFGCYGDELGNTPNIDKLASQGCIYNNTFSTAGVCAPSRSAIITGMYQTSIGTMHMRTSHTHPDTPEMPTPYSTVLPHYVKAFTEYLRAAGYYCSNNEKTDYQFETPVTAWDESSFDGHWRNRKLGQPFFSVFNRILTHESAMWKHPDRLLKTDPDKIVLPPYLPDTPKCREALAHQYDNIAMSDHIVGNILKELEDDGLAENTIVFLWSDHGEGLPRAKRWPYDAGIRVPMIVRWPGKLKPGTSDERLVSLVDLAPTVLKLAGVPVPSHLQGQSFLDDEDEPRTYVYATRDRYDESYDMVRAVRDQRFKYIRNYYPNLPYLLWIPFSHDHAAWQELWRLKQEGKLEGAQQLLLQDTRPPEELYDCENDPFEIHNLAGDPNFKGQLKRLRKELDQWRDAVGDLGEMSESEMVARMYPGGIQPTTSKPIVVPIHATHPGKRAVEGEVSFEAPLHVMLHSSTQGASIAFTTEEAEKPNWQLYTGPIRIEVGMTSVRAKAIRIGYRESEEVEVKFRVAEPTK